MLVQIRTIDARTKKMLDVSKTTSIIDLKKRLRGHFDLEPEQQRLFFRGKQLEDEYTLFDYNINMGDMIQIMEKVTFEPVPEKTDDEKPSTSKEIEPECEKMEVESDTVEKTTYFQVGEYVDARDETYGAWFEGKINKIHKDNDYEKNKVVFQDDEKDGCPHDGYFYEINLEDNGEVLNTITNRLLHVRPKSKTTLPFIKLQVGKRVLCNYNIEEPKKRGYWYDGVITDLTSKRSGLNTVTVNLIIGASAPLEGCKLANHEDIFEIQPLTLLADREPVMEPQPSRITDIPISCDHCNNNTRRKCKECGCRVCGLKTEENKQIMCDECDYAYHIWCLKQPLEEVPDTDEWYCDECKNDENEIVIAGSKLKESKKKSKLASKSGKSTRDWGKGMACVGRTSICTIVPSNHFGPIPGVEVGTLWKYRLQVSEAGVHRPHVAGIHGRENVGAFSVVLSGGYEDDVDKGEEFYYTGSGGRDLSGNKRTSVQCCDQKLDRYNKALAINCPVKLNDKVGAEAKDWKKGKPVRVVRNYQLKKHSKYAPDEGNRYDGIYKVVKYFPQKGKAGFIVWRYLFRRDDPIPAPWTAAGKKRIEELGLVMQYPLAGKVELQEDYDQPETPKKGSKRVLVEQHNPQPKAESPKKNIAKYVLDEEVDLIISKDNANEKLWNECKEETELGKTKFLEKVRETFECICCTELTFKPITTPCHHNICTDCMKQSFKAQVMTCPTCRAPIDEGMLKTPNVHLQKALNHFFPGYSASR